uniref:Uncharacterized protein n=1 Tax=Physcomitrium patens TaxID=3218 RepID=A0A2K1KVT3_PHYPA|nr:hypothetical protein PHYPA_004899 [Physcomitrium patens]
MSVKLTRQIFTPITFFRRSFSSWLGVGAYFFSSELHKGRRMRCHCLLISTPSPAIPYSSASSVPASTSYSIF